jgi:hypothetical protein
MISATDFIPFFCFHFPLWLLPGTPHPSTEAWQACYGMRRVILPQRGLIGPSAGFYLVFAFPLHRHISIQIILFLTDEDTGFTGDSTEFAWTSPFLLLQTVTFRQVDTPSVASLSDSDG